MAKLDHGAARISPRSTIMAGACAILLGGPLLPPPAAAQPAASGVVTFFLTDPASSGAGLLGRGSVTFHGKDYPFTVTGMHLAKTSADAPKGLTGPAYGLNNVADVNGDYATVGEPTASSYVLQNAKGVRVELSPVFGGARLPPHDAAHPITIKLVDGAAG